MTTTAPKTVPADQVAPGLDSAESLYQFERISANEISPDGHHVVYVVHRVERATEKRYSDLWIVPTDGGRPRRYTWGNWTDHSPKWSPDGQTIAFLSNRGDEKQFQLCLLPFGGGEARPLTDLKGSFGGYDWSPDGRTIAFSFTRIDPAVAEREQDEQKKKLGVVAHHVTRIFYKANGAGYLPAEKSHIWTVSVDDGVTTQITDGEHDEGAPRYAPDGRTLIFSSNRSDDPDFDMDNVQLYTVPATGGDIVHLPIANHPWQKYGAVYAPDGQQIAYLGREFAKSWWQNLCLYVVPADGGDAVNLSQAHDLNLFGPTASDVNSGVPTSGLRWAPDGSKLYFTAAHHGQQALMALSLDGALETLVAHGAVGGFSFDSAHARMAYWYSDWSTPSQIAVREMATGATTQLTQLNGWLDDVTLGAVEEHWLERPDGGRVQGWIIFPPDFDPQRAYPSILQIHGGPQTQDGNAFSHEFRFLAHNGYVVYTCNPRGSTGYGNDHCGAIHGRWGTVDFEDVMAWADFMAQQPYIDTARMGVTGGSYGGYMTGTIIGRTPRFQAAVVQRMVSNSLSMHGTCDFNHGWPTLIGLPRPWDDPLANWEASPMSRVAHVTTPTLVIHSEGDLRTNLEQGEQFYVALRTLGVPSEMVIFPQETHDLSRSGRTDRRVARLGHMLRWFDRYLK